MYKTTALGGKKRGGEGIRYTIKPPERKAGGSMKIFFPFLDFGRKGERKEEGGKSKILPEEGKSFRAFSISNFTWLSQR